MDEEYFDFNEVEEVPEEPDFNNIKNCPYCGKPIPENSLLCLYCGRSVSQSSHPRWVIITAFIVCIIFIFVLLLVLF